jgi:hypothetical protein
MEKKFNYTIDDPFVRKLSAILIIAGPVIWFFAVFYEMDIGRFLGIVITLMGIAVCFMRATLTLKDEGIELRKAFGDTKIIPYDEVDWVKVDAECASTGSRDRSGYSLFYKMTIITQQGNIVIRESGGSIMNKSVMYDVYAKDRLLLSSPFCEAESFIREKKGMDPKPAALTSFLREAEAKKSSFGRI